MSNLVLPIFFFYIMVIDIVRNIIEVYTSCGKQHAHEDNAKERLRFFLNVVNASRAAGYTI